MDHLAVYLYAFFGLRTRMAWNECNYRKWECEKRGAQVPQATHPQCMMQTMFQLCWNSIVVLEVTVYRLSVNGLKTEHTLESEKRDFLFSAPL